MDDGDECFDLDNLEYASDFGAPPDLETDTIAYAFKISRLVLQSQIKGVK